MKLISRGTTYLTNSVLYMLVDEQYAYIFPIMCISVEGLFNGGCFGFGINDKKGLLSIRRLCHMLRALH